MQRIMDTGSRILSCYTSRPSSFLSRYRYRTITLKTTASRAARAEVNPAHYSHLLSSTSSYLVRVANEHVDLERPLRETTKQLSTSCSGLKLLTNRGCLLNCCRNEEHSNVLGDRRESSSNYCLLETSLHRVGVTDAHRSWGLNNLIASGL